MSTDPWSLDYNPDEEVEEVNKKEPVKNSKYKKPWNGYSNVSMKMKTSWRR